MQSHRFVTIFELLVAVAGDEEFAAVGLFFDGPFLPRALVDTQSHLLVTVLELLVLVAGEEESRVSAGRFVTVAVTVAVAVAVTVTVAGCGSRGLRHGFCELTRVWNRITCPIMLVACALEFLDLGPVVPCAAFKLRRIEFSTVLPHQTHAVAIAAACVILTIGHSGEAAEIVHAARGRRFLEMKGAGAVAAVR